jgi:acetyl-CoA carboxylase carboxyl transferase subunit alpha
MEMAALRTPIVCAVIGEGGSGGALAIGMGDRLLMCENAWYSVISPEGCAAILFRDAARAAEAALALKLTAPELKALGVIDEVVPEPQGGAHRDVPAMMEAMRARLVQAIEASSALPLDALLEARYRKFRSLGAWREAAAAQAGPRRRSAKQQRIANG